MASYHHDKAMKAAYLIAEALERLTGYSASVISRLSLPSETKSITIECNCYVTYAIGSTWKDIAEQLACAWRAVRTIEELRS